MTTKLPPLTDEEVKQLEEWKAQRPKPIIKNPITGVMKSVGIAANIHSQFNILGQAVSRGDVSPEEAVRVLKELQTHAHSIIKKYTVPD